MTANHCITHLSLRLPSFTGHGKHTDWLCISIELHILHVHLNPYSSIQNLAAKDDMGNDAIFMKASGNTSIYLRDMTDQVFLAYASHSDHDQCNFSNVNLIDAWTAFANQ